MLQKLASFTAKGAFCYRKGQLEGSVQEGADISELQSLTRPPQKPVAQSFSPVITLSKDGDRAGTHCWCPDSLHQPFFPEGKQSRFYQVGLLLPAPPLTGDSPGTTSERQRLTHQVPCNRSLARTIHLSPIQLPDVTVIVPRVTAGNLLCPRHL